MPRLCEFYPDICLTTEDIARKNLSQSILYIYQNTHTLQNPRIHTHTHTNTHTHITKQYKTTTAQIKTKYNKKNNLIKHTVVTVYLKEKSLSRFVCDNAFFLFNYEQLCCDLIFRYHYVYNPCLSFLYFSCVAKEKTEPLAASPFRTILVFYCHAFTGSRRRSNRILSSPQNHTSAL